MNQQKTKPKLSTRALYLWSLGLVVVGFGLLLLIKYWTATTFCTIGAGCGAVTAVGNVGRPIGAVLFLLGIGLFIGNSIRYFALRRKR